jgi:hypothetical protein
MKNRQPLGPARTSAAAPVTITATPATPAEALQYELDSLKTLVKSLATAKPGKKAAGSLETEIAAAQASVSLARVEAALAGGAKLSPAQTALLKTMRAKLEKTLAQAREMSTKTV